MRSGSTPSLTLCRTVDRLFDLIFVVELTRNVDEHKRPRVEDGVKLGFSLIFGHVVYRVSF